MKFNKLNYYTGCSNDSIYIRIWPNGENIAEVRIGVDNVSWSFYLGTVVLILSNPYEERFLCNPLYFWCNRVDGNLRYHDAFIVLYYTVQHKYHQ